MTIDDVSQAVEQSGGGGGGGFDRVARKDSG